MNPSSIRRRPIHSACIAMCLCWLGVFVSVSEARNFRLPFSTASQTPHPAVARINVEEKGATSHGTGSLVSVAGQHGLVVTNWHVIRDAAGEISVEFSDGFRSAARVLKIDQDWDLAALQIWRPTVKPISIAVTAPRPGDTLAIAGYGSGQYRTVSGRCTQYVAPGANLPYEMVELSAEARQGDSGGPIFNERGELAGVLFGASLGTTSGSYCGRVTAFLATFLEAGQLDPNQPAGDIHPRGTRTVIAGGTTGPADPPVGSHAALQGRELYPLPPISPRPTDVGSFVGVKPYFGASPRITPAVDLSPPHDVSSFSAPVYRNGSRLGGAAWSASDANERLLSSVEEPAIAPWEEFIGKTPLEQGKSILAVIGILAVLLRLSSVLAGSRD